MQANDDKKIEQEMDALIKQLDQWNYEYYVLDNPSVSDAVYDKAMNKLIMLEKEYPELKRLDSPTMRVGGFVSKKFEKVKHLAPMLSLANAFNDGELIKFDSDIKKVLGNEKYDYIIEPKIDGLSISLIYKDAKLERALTRGDGTFGEDVTVNILTIKEIPQFINKKYTNQIVEVRGEVYMDKKDFDHLNEQLSNEDKPFANPRNAAAGTLRNLDSSVAASRKLKAFFYYMPQWKEMGFKTHTGMLNWLKDNKFLTAPQIKQENDIYDVIKGIEILTEIRNNLDYQIDGVVVKLNQYLNYEKIGYTSKFPKWAIAYKFPAEIGLTQLINITCEVGRTGKITYVGDLKPILLDGSMVSHVSLNNADYIKHKNININDYVYIFKAGDIIPYLDYVALDKRPQNIIPFQEATHCPSCGAVLVRENDDVDQRCLNPNCRVQNIRKIDYFCSRECMNINGVSYMIIEKLYDYGFLKNVTDLYKLENYKQEILALDLKIKDKAFSNIINSINASKDNSLEHLINALSIRHLGKTMSKKLAQKFKTLEAFIKADYESLIAIRDVGEALANEIINFFSNDENMLMVNELISFDINTTYKTTNLNVTIDENSPYLNKTMVITGTFSQPRETIKAFLEDHYHIHFVNSISKKVDYLLVGSDPGSKLEKAQALNIPIISEEFWKNE